MLNKTWHLAVIFAFIFGRDVSLSESPSWDITSLHRDLFLESHIYYSWDLAGIFSTDGVTEEWGRHHVQYDARLAYGGWLEQRDFHSKYSSWKLDIFCWQAESYVPSIPLFWKTYDRTLVLFSILSEFCTGLAFWVRADIWYGWFWYLVTRSLKGVLPPIYSTCLREFWFGKGASYVPSIPLHGKKPDGRIVFFHGSFCLWILDELPHPNPPGSRAPSGGLHANDLFCLLRAQQSSTTLFS